MKVLNQTNGKNWVLYHGDSCEVLKGLPDGSVQLCVHSPPFVATYIYSSSEADLGNSNSNEEFFKHYDFIIKELFRVLTAGRIVCVHCKDLPKFANRDGAAGLYDFPGDCVRAFEKAGFVYHSRVTVWKCPVTERERTNNNGLLHKTVLRDSSQLRMGMADFVLCFRKPPVGTNLSDKPITRPNGFTDYVGDPDKDPRTTSHHPSKYARTDDRGVGLGLDASPPDESIVIWRRYAEPAWWDLAAKFRGIADTLTPEQFGLFREMLETLGPKDGHQTWFDIDQTDVLNCRKGKADGDERHICPLQLSLIRRCVGLWSQPGDVVLDPFSGIGSTGHEALLAGRKYVGVELKESYHKRAVINLERAEEIASRRSLVDVAEGKVAPG